MPVYCILSIHQYTLFLDMLIWWIFWDRQYNRDTVFCLFAWRSRFPGFGLTPIALSRPRDFQILDLATETCGTPFSGHTTLGCSLPEAPDWADSRLSAREIVPWPWHDEWLQQDANLLSERARSGWRYQRFISCLLMGWAPVARNAQRGWMFESTGITAYNFAVSHGARWSTPTVC